MLNMDDSVVETSRLDKVIEYLLSCHSSRNWVMLRGN